MHISGLTSSQVWLSSSRSLTNFGSGALAPSDTTFTTLAANASVDFRSSAGIVGLMSIGVVTGGTATGLIAIQQFDGSANFIRMAVTAAAANAAIGFTAVTTNSVGPRIQNTDAAVAGAYNVAAFVLTI